MSVDLGGLEKYGDALRAAAADMPAIMDELVVGEGVYATGQARKIAREKKINNTGLYIRSFQADKKSHRQGDAYKVAFYNNADYAKHLEYGFRSHFVPGHWEGDTFVYEPGSKAGGMYVGKPGGYVRGRFVFRDACKRTALTKDARLRRKFIKILKRYTEG